MNFSGQLESLAITLLTGILLGIMFDFYRILRGLIRPRHLFGSLADLLYWLLATGVVFFALLIGSWGEIRLYMFLGLAVGALFYFRLISRTMIRILIAVLRRTVHTVRGAMWLAGYAMRPLIFIFRLAGWPLRYLSRKIIHKKPPPADNIPPQ